MQNEDSYFPNRELSAAMKMGIRSVKFSIPLSLFSQQSTSRRPSNQPNFTRMEVTKLTRHLLVKLHPPNLVNTIFYLVF